MLRRIVLALTSAALAVGVPLGLATPASAASLGTVVWSASLTPSELPNAMVGDTFTLSGGGGGEMLVNGTGSVSYGMTSCAPHSCYLPLGLALTVTSLGTVTIQSASGTVLATLTLGPASSAGGGSAPQQVASQPPSVTATPGNGVVQLSISPGTGGTGSAQFYSIEYQADTACNDGRRGAPRVIDSGTVSCRPCPRVIAVVDSVPCAEPASRLVTATASGSAVATITGLVNGRSYEFSVKEMTTDQLWSGATTVTSTPVASATCTKLSVGVAQPSGEGAASVTTPISGSGSPFIYPFIAPPYGGMVNQAAMGSWTTAGATGAAGGEYATFTPITDAPCPITVTAPEGTSLSTSTGIAWNGGTSSATVFSGTPVYVFGTKTGDYAIGFSAGASGAVKVTPRVRIGTVPQAAYSIAVSPATQRLDVNSLGTVKSTVTDAFGNPVAGADVSLVANGGVLLGGSQSAAQTKTGSDGSSVSTAIAGSSAASATVTASLPSTSTAWAMAANYVRPTGFPTPTSSVQAQVVVAKPVERTIIITGERTTVSGKPGIMVKGITTGFAAGAVVKPFFRFPGETSYTEGSARPEVDAAGEFTWTRKTGKKFYAYVVSEDGLVQSNRVIIPAN